VTQKQRTSASYPPDAYWLYFVGPPVTPAFPQYDCAVDWLPAPGRQLGSDANAVVLPVIDCQSLAFA
jgi:hypothetical protein